MFHLGSVIRTMDDPWEAQRLIREAEESGLEPTTAVYKYVNQLIRDERSDRRKTVRGVRARSARISILFTFSLRYKNITLLTHATKTSLEKQRSNPNVIMT